MPIRKIKEHHHFILKGIFLSLFLSKNQNQTILITMKAKAIILNLSIFTLIVTSSCFNQSEKKNSASKNEVSVNDTTEILKAPFKNNRNKVEYEVSVKKGTKIKHGIQTRFYDHGSVYSKINYKNGKKNGMAYTYYPEYKDAEPKVWKEQPYIEGKLSGICKRYHKNGKLQAEYEYYEGFPAIGLKEWKETGDPINLPTLKVNKEVINHQTYLSASMSNNAKNVKYYEGTLLNGKYVTKNIIPLLTKDGVGELTIPHTSNKKNVTIIAMLSTRYRNTYYVAQTVNLK